MRSNVLHERFLQNGTANKGVRSPTFFVPIFGFTIQLPRKQSSITTPFAPHCGYFHIVYHI